MLVKKSQSGRHTLVIVAKTFRVVTYPFSHISKIIVCLIIKMQIYNLENSTYSETSTTSADNDGIVLMINHCVLSNAALTLYTTKNQ